MKKLLSVNVGLPTEIVHKGKAVRTGIFKAPVDGPVMLRKLNLDGDGQADLDNHGGEFRAAYVYTIENYEHWKPVLERGELPYGQFGENLTVSGMPEDEVHIGDIFKIGAALVQVTQPRPPCFKLGIRVGLVRFPKLFLASERVGFYLRVLEEGQVEAGDAIELIEAHPAGVTVKDLIHVMYFAPDDLEVIERASRIEALTPRWRELLLDRLDRRQAKSSL